MKGKLMLALIIAMVMSFGGAAGAASYNVDLEGQSVSVTLEDGEVSGEGTASSDGGVTGSISSPGADLSY